MEFVGVLVSIHSHSTFIKKNLLGYSFVYYKNHFFFIRFHVRRFIVQTFFLNFRVDLSVYEKQISKSIVDYNRVDWRHVLTARVDFAPVTYSSEVTALSNLFIWTLIRLKLVFHLIWFSLNFQLYCHTNKATYLDRKLYTLTRVKLHFNWSNPMNTKIIDVIFR